AVSWPKPLSMKVKAAASMARAWRFWAGFKRAAVPGRSRAEGTTLPEVPSAPFPVKQQLATRDWVWPRASRATPEVVGGARPNVSGRGGALLRGRFDGGPAVA